MAHAHNDTGQGSFWNHCSAGNSILALASIAVSQVSPSKRTMCGTTWTSWRWGMIRGFFTGGSRECYSQPR